VEENKLKSPSAVWMVDFETPVCKLYLLFLTADAAKQRKKKKKVLLSLVFQSLQSIQ
jgi:hypothetical protein